MESTLLEGNLHNESFPCRDTSLAPLGYHITTLRLLRGRKRQQSGRPLSPTRTSGSETGNIWWILSLSLEEAIPPIPKLLTSLLYKYRCMASLKDVLLNTGFLKSEN